MCALNRVRKRAAGAARKISASKRALCHLGFFRCRRRRRVIVITRFRIRERRRIACALSLLTVFKFVAIMRQSARNGKQNTAMRRSAPAACARRAMMRVDVNRR
jgi:hypothetical protein